MKISINSKCIKYNVNTHTHSNPYKVLQNVFQKKIFTNTINKRTFFYLLLLFFYFVVN